LKSSLQGGFRRVLNKVLTLIKLKVEELTKAKMVSDETDAAEKSSGA
jgi:hypothetical protein